MENTSLNSKVVDAFAELEQGVHTALETYSNVHRGSGHNSMVTTHLFEQARDITLDYLGLSKDKYTVIFCTPRRAEFIVKQLNPNSYKIVSSQDIGLAIGVRVLAVKRNALPKGAPFHVGGGTTKLISRDWVIWAKEPDKFEAGTPAIVNVIAFAIALRLTKQFGKDIFKNPSTEKLSAKDILYHDELEKYSGQELLNEFKKTLIGRGKIVPTMEGPQPFTNLDNSASTPTFTPIWNSFRQTLRQKDNQEIIQEVKSICSGMLGAPLNSYDIIFTSNTTEALNISAENFSRESDGTETVVVNTLLEHSSNDLPWRLVPNNSLIRLSVNDGGFVDLNELETLLIAYNQKNQYGNKRVKLVAVNGASNVLGVCNKLAEISRIVHQYGAQLLVDAAQLAAHRKINIEELGIDYLACSAHKLYAPFGCGVLVVKKGLLNFNPDELKLIQLSGEENLGGIAALGKSLVLLQRIGMDLIQSEEKALTKRALHGMLHINGLKIFGIQDTESPEFEHKLGVIVFKVKGLWPNELAKELAVRSGIGVRFGCHCAHIIVKHILHVPPTLEQFQRIMQTLFPKIKFPGVTRVSIGIENSEEDIDRLIQELGNIAKDAQSPKDKQSTYNLSSKDVLKQMKEFTKDLAQKVYA